MKQIAMLRDTEGQQETAALFRIRQVFTGWDKEERTENEKEVFKEIRVMQTSRRVLKEAVTVFKAWLSSLREFRRAPERYTGKPRMPKYLKGDRHTYYITNQDAVLYPVYRKENAGSAGTVTGEYDGMELKLPGIKERLFLRHVTADSRLKEVQVKPYYGKFLLVLVLEKEDLPVCGEKPHLAGIDLGTDNIAAIVSTDHASRISQAWRRTPGGHKR